LLLSVVLALAVVGCDRATAIPPGAQVINVTIAGPNVVLDPPTATAGDVYLVVDAPPNSSLSFVEAQAAPDAVPGPLSDADLARLARGDTALTSITGFDPGGCSADQAAADRGKMGPCGNVMKIVVVPGTYAFLSGAPEPDPATGKVLPITVLDVAP
jgi:hypothetical protein